MKAQIKEKLLPYRLLLFLLMVCHTVYLQTNAYHETAPVDSSVSLHPSWEFSGETYFYFLPEEDFYVMPIAAGDCGRLHLEARYNYEDFRSFSFFTGRIFTTGGKNQLEVIPLLGGVIGNRLGIVPGMEIDVLWNQFEFYSEAEYVFDLRRRDSNFFYNWAESRYYLGNWLLLGVTSQQTREVAEGWLIENGFLAGLNFSSYSGLVYLFNPGGEDRYTIFTVAIVF